MSEDMLCYDQKAEPHVMYDGRLVPKAHFRVFIYNSKGEEKLVNSWDEYEKEISSGLWFAKKEDVPLRVTNNVIVRNDKHKGGK